MSIRRDMRRTRYRARAHPPDPGCGVASPNMETAVGRRRPVLLLPFSTWCRSVAPRPQEESSMSEDTEQPGPASAAGEPVAPTTPGDHTTPQPTPTPSGEPTAPS